jgi:hypothetical protein
MVDGLAQPTTWPPRCAVVNGGRIHSPAADSRDADAADPGPADVWALAKTLWVLLTWRIPSLARNPQGNRGSSLPARADHVRIRAELDRMLEKATLIAPEKRISMADMAHELHACAAPPPEVRQSASLDELRTRMAALTAAPGPPMTHWLSGTETRRGSRPASSHPIVHVEALAPSSLFARRCTIGTRRFRTGAGCAARSAAARPGTGSCEPPAFRWPEDVGWLSGTWLSGTRSFS